MGTMSAEGQVLSLQQPKGKASTVMGRCLLCVWANGTESRVSPGATGGLEASLSWSGDGQSPACLSQVLTAGGGVGQLCEDLGDLCGAQDRGVTVSPIQTSPSGAAVRLQPPNQAWGPHRQLCSVSVLSETGQRVSEGFPGAQVLLPGSSRVRARCLTHSLCFTATPQRPQDTHSMPSSAAPFLQSATWQRPRTSERPVPSARSGCLAAKRV